jgi:ATP-dependent Lon protease
MIELAPKGTGKSYVFGNLSKYGWLISGGKVSRAKLFYDKTRQQPGIMKNYDFCTFDEIQTIIFQDPSEMQASLKSYLESGKTSFDNYEFMSECSTMLMGNIPLSSSNLPLTPKYFNSLPESFRESALLDRFHGFIEGWYLPRVNKSMILKDWTLNVEYFSEVLHLLRTSPEYSMLVNEVVYSEEKSDLRDLKAVQKIASAYSKLLFPHITSVSKLDKSEFKLYCLDPAIHRRRIIKEQCGNIDSESSFSKPMPEIRLK